MLILYFDIVDVFSSQVHTRSGGIQSLYFPACISQQNDIIKSRLIVGCLCDTTQQSGIRDYGFWALDNLGYFFLYEWWIIWTGGWIRLNCANYIYGRVKCKIYSLLNNSMFQSLRRINRKRRQRKNGSCCIVKCVGW